MRLSKKVQKLFFLCAFVLFTIWFWVERPLMLQISPTGEISIVQLTESENLRDFSAKKRMKPNLKYILQWNRPNREPFTFMKVGQDVFIERRCNVSNCYVTSNRNYLQDILNYDAILFYGHDVSRRFIRLPKRRSLYQNYVFVSSESPAYYPVNYERYNSFFNLTWTYKLNSDVFYGYILIRNKQGDIIGPKEVMHWPKIQEMNPIDHELKEKLSNKKLAAAWFVSNCHSKSGREKVAVLIQHELAKYNMTIDVYGLCGTKQSPSREADWQMLETDYYFYLSFENSISEDYVTEKILNALWHYTVPIVYGGANYTRFMPDGIYLNARTHSTQDLVKQMIDLINNKDKYYDYFRWHNHYTYYYAGDTPETDHYCNFCKKINDENSNKVKIYKNFTKWWNGDSKGSYFFFNKLLLLLLLLY